MELEAYGHKKISIHALREEGDTQTLQHESRLTYFYPRPPRGGRLLRLDQTIDQQAISIHALREEGDLVCQELF